MQASVCVCVCLWIADKDVCRCAAQWAGDDRLTLRTGTGKRERARCLAWLNVRAEGVSADL